MRILIAVFIVLVVSGCIQQVESRHPVRAMNLSITTVGDLHERCEFRRIFGDKSNTQTIACAGYFSGFFDAYTFIKDETNVNLQFCMPVGVTTLQAARVFRKWSTTNPEQHNIKAAIGLVSSLRQVFPCVN